MLARRCSDGFIAACRESHLCWRRILSSSPSCSSGSRRWRWRLASFSAATGIKRAIEAQAGAALGRPVTIGSAVPRFFPRVGLELTRRRDRRGARGRRSTTFACRPAFRGAAAPPRRGRRGLGRAQPHRSARGRSRCSTRWPIRDAVARPRPAIAFAIDSIGSIAFSDVTLVAGDHHARRRHDLGAERRRSLTVERLDGEVRRLGVPCHPARLRASTTRTGKFDVESRSPRFRRPAGLSCRRDSGRRPRRSQAGKPAAPVAIVAATTSRSTSGPGRAARWASRSRRSSRAGVSPAAMSTSTGLTFDLFGGRFDGSAGFIGSGDRAASQWKGRFEGLDVPAARRVCGRAGLDDGPARRVGSTSPAPGADPVAPIQRARGIARLTITDGRVAGLDLVRTSCSRSASHRASRRRDRARLSSRMAATLAVDRHDCHRRTI